MSSLVVHKPLHPHDSSARAWILRLSGIFRSWMAYHRQRQALGDLAEYNRHLLRDIGLSPEQAQREAAKWFWQR